MIGPIIVFLLALAIYLPFNSFIPITDPVEANYALTAKEMLLSGNWLSPQIYGHFWYDKPAMIYWLIAASYRLFGVGEFAARFPAALFSAASVGYIYWFGKKIFGNWRIGMLAALVLATSLEYWVLSRMILTDAVLFFFGSVALASFYLGISDRGKSWYIAAYFFAGLAVLTKGPVGIILPALVIFVYIVVTRRWNLLSKLFLLPGLAIFLLTAAPWYVAMYRIHGQEFVNTFLGLHNFLRATVSEHPKDNVFYYYLILFPVSMLPWTGMFLRSLFNRGASHFSFLAIWTGVIVIFFSLMATKYPTYALPALFPAALLTAQQMEQMQACRPRQWLWLSLPALLMLLAVAVGTKLLLPGVDHFWFYLVAGISALIICCMQVRGEKALMPLAVGAMVSIVSLLIISQAMIPLAATRSAKAAAKVLPSSGAVVAAYGDYPTSAGFYSGYLIPHLVLAENTVAHNVWAGKHTEPTETVAAFTERTADNPETYILVGKDSQLPLNGFQQVGEYGNYDLYKRTSR